MWIPVGLGAFALIAAGRWINYHRGISILVGSILAVAGLAWTSRYAGRRLAAHRARSIAPTSLRAYQLATPGQFEAQIAALCRRDRATDVRVVGGAGDLAADVLLTTPDGRRMLIQAKRYQAGNKVKSAHVQQVNGTYRDVHGCTLAAIVTTSDYTRDATNLGQRVGIRLYAAADLEAWANGSGRAPWH